MSTSECSICYECITNYGKKLTCGHKFHANCILKWFELKRSNKCPYCVQYVDFVLITINDDASRFVSNFVYETESRDFLLDHFSSSLSNPIQNDELVPYYLAINHSYNMIIKLNLGRIADVIAAYSMLIDFTFNPFIPLDTDREADKYISYPIEFLCQLNVTGQPLDDLVVLANKIFTNENYSLDDILYMRPNGNLLTHMVEHENKSNEFLNVFLDFLLGVQSDDADRVLKYVNVQTEIDILNTVNRNVPKLIRLGVDYDDNYKRFKPKHTPMATNNYSLGPSAPMPYMPNNYMSGLVGPLNASQYLSIVPTHPIDSTIHVYANSLNGWMNI
jgi:hypothetical protein